MGIAMWSAAVHLLAKIVLRDRTLRAHRGHTEAVGGRVADRTGSGDEKVEVCHTTGGFVAVCAHGCDGFAGLTGTGDEETRHSGLLERPGAHSPRGRLWVECDDRCNHAHY